MLYGRLNPGTEQCVIRPVRHKCANCTYGNIVNSEHDQCKNRKCQPAVGYHAVDLIRRGKFDTALCFFNCFSHQFLNIIVALAGDDTFGVIIHFLFAVFNMLLQMRHCLSVNMKSRDGFFITLKDLHRVPAKVLPIAYQRFDGLFNMGDGMFNAAGKYMWKFIVSAFSGCLKTKFNGLVDRLALQGRNFNDFTAKLRGKLFNVNLVAVFPDKIHHVDGNHHRETNFSQLRGQVQVPLDICTIDDIQYNVRFIIHQIISGNDFLIGIRAQGINTGKILNDYIMVSAVMPFLLFNGNPRPVSNILVTAGKIVKQCSLSAVRVSCQCNFNCHVKSSFLFSFLFFLLSIKACLNGGRCRSRLLHLQNVCVLFSK